ncbi:MAG: hypothetical protein PF542_04920 [Nanoarchaeota archaeon]|jgi:heme/copper-type cytochrome/quinol oxidase subunit 2|nr:hypothetical protein [Nanoarchaeota archaeon]
MKNNKAQIGDTVTWLIATIVIVVFLMFFIFAAAMLGNTKVVGGFKSSLFSSEKLVGDEIIVKKTIYSFLTAKGDTSKKKIGEYLTELDKEEDMKINVTEEKIRIGGNLNK